MTVRTGDKIKVTLEGKVRYAGSDSSDISLFSHYGAEFQIGGVSHDAITVVKSNLKIGDAVNRHEDYQSLPAGSVVRDGVGTGVKTNAGHWTWSDDPDYQSSPGHYSTLVYIPD